MSSDGSSAHGDAGDGGQQVDVAVILKGFKVLKDGDSSDEVPMDKSAADAFLAVVQDSSNAEKCIDQLFPTVIPVDSSFFDRLDEFRRWIGVADSADEAIGILWSDAMQRLELAEQQELLSAFVTQQGHDFFECLGSLHIVVKDHALPASFLAGWFTDLVQAVERDLMQDSVWKAIRTCCESQTGCALEVLWMLTTPPEDRRLNIAGFMLGAMRSVELDESQEEEFKRAEEFFESHADHQFRSVFNWSWGTTARDVGITEEQLRSLFARADGGTEEDRSSAVSVVCRITTGHGICDELFTLCFEWIAGKLDSSLSSAAKCYVANAAARLASVKPDNDRPKVDCSSWIIAIQPVSEDDTGTWHEIERYLYDLLKADQRAFCDVFERLCATSAATLKRFMQQPRSFELLLGELRNADVAEMVGRLAMSLETPTRRLGVCLFDALKVESIPDGSFKRNGDLGMRLLLFEMQRTMLGAQSLARFFVSLIRHLKLADEGFKGELFDELKLQSRNFAGGCRQELENRGGELPLVTEALEDVGEYFEELKRAHKAGMNAMEVVGHRRASMLCRRRFSRQVSRGAKEHSLLLGLVKHVSLLYGQASSTFIDGKLQDAIPLAHISSSMEIPIVDFCDPEQMAMRRLNASAAIQTLSERSGSRANDAEADDE